MKKNILFFLLSAVSFGAFAQDTHFSQYYASPLTLNPALVGKFDGLWRATAIYRGQWFAPQSLQPYSTVSASADFSLLKERMNGNALGVGLVVTNDLQNFMNAGDSRKSMINQTRLGLSLGYTLALGDDKQYQISVGFQPQIEFSKLDFNYTFHNGFQPDLSYVAAQSGETGLAFPNKTSFNMSAGLFFNAKPLEWMTVFAGYSLFNAARPSFTFLETSSINGYQYRRPFRHAASVGFEFEVIEKILIIPGAYFQYQAKATEIDAGATVGYKIADDGDKTAIVFLGCWGRAGRDIIPKLGFEYNRFRFGAAVDVRLAQMQKDAKEVARANQPMSFEISLAYIGGLGKPPKEHKYLFSPRF